MNTFIYRSKFPINKEILFRFHEEPIGFQTLVGGTKGIEIIQPPKSLAIGEEVIFKIRIFPFWKTIWIARHIAYQQNHFFVDRQEKGPFLKFQHTHLFLDGTDGKNSCILSEEIEINFYLWPLSRFFIFPFLYFMFRKRHELTAKHFGVKEELIFCRYS
ncbi:hypothetical protein EHQ23_18720 [Leptospira bourretii]|uniref:Ligand-binding SRPBCC domain-containing protein n=2 Tax=Leptospira TaxID=171 RepID=A0A4R9IK55_9LEPT|nr:MULTISPECIES: hypothetical protein [Leptospira]TGK79626.1 hypothetical protein EHQ23_18720 [Leptospira bourretii]TGK89836.1 hypothetical protein EHQ26_15570 [Leptospira bourretii]TGL31261.1 hypothetical protein EHQ45_12115 [Leptospira bourretii]TGM82074.1 hypothetical protein EHR01_04615 [Leptospira mtsangambouensis]